MRKLLDRGIRRRWLQCTKCPHRWTSNEIIGEPQPRIRVELTDDILREILTGNDSPHELQRRYGINRTTVSSIRLGKIHARRVPDVPRWAPRRSCSSCQHWRIGDDEIPSRCSFGFPDPIEEGVWAARWCNLYQEEQCAASS